MAFGRLGSIGTGFGRVGAGAGGGAPWVLAPLNASAPVISGAAVAVGFVLSVTDGAWVGSPTSFAYQWKRGVTNVGTNVNTYTLVAGDVGFMMTCVVTATNGFGSTPATSNALGPVVAALPPINTVAPVATGTAAVGSLLSTTNGTWSGGTPTYTYQWRRASTNIVGATGATYTLVSADANALVSCNVTATNAGGAATASSNTIGPVITSGAVVGGSALLVSETDGFAVDFTYPSDAQRVSVKVDGTVVFGVGGAGLLSEEVDGFAVDFTYPTDANRVAVKVGGIPVFGPGGGSLLQGESLGLGVDFTYLRNGSRVAVKT